MFKATTPLERLRQPYGMAALPDSIKTETDALGETGHQASKPNAQAIIDDVAVAIQALGNKVDTKRRRAALRRPHDQAHRASRVGLALTIGAALRSAEGDR